MIIRDTTPRAFEFACHAASCAPPPAGTGGSGGRSGAPVKPNPIGPGGRRNPAQGMINKTIKDAEAKAATQVRASDLKRGDKVVFAQKVREISSLGKQRNGKVGISFKDGGITDLRPDQMLPRPSKKVRVPAGSAAGKMLKQDKKYAMNPNNRANSQMHPDSKPETGKIIRPPKAKTTPPRVKRRGGPYDPGEQDQSNEVWA